MSTPLMFLSDADVFARNDAPLAELGLLAFLVNPEVLDNCSLMVLTDIAHPNSAIRSVRVERLDWIRELPSTWIVIPV